MIATSNIIQEWDYTYIFTYMCGFFSKKYNSFPFFLKMYDQIC